MKTIDVRIRIAILWALWAAAATFSVVLWLLVEPGALEEALAGEMEGFASDGGVGYYMAISGILPLALAVMTLQFDNRATRYTNLIAGLVLGCWTFVDLGYAIADGAAFNASMLVSVSASLIAFLIAGLSAAALRRKAPERTTTTHEVIEQQRKPAV
jgi:hypothetical protein